MMVSLDAMLAQFRLAWPAALLLVAVPVALAWLQRRRAGPGSAAGAAAIRLPLAVVLKPHRAPVRATAIAFWGAYACLVIAAARPQWVEWADPQPVSGRDLLVVIDVSASMGTRDLRLGDDRLSRIDGARRAAIEVVSRRPGDRVGLLVFSGQAYLHVPLTFDTAATLAAIDALETGFAGPTTAFGDALALAVRTLVDSAGTGRAPAGSVVVLLTDGWQTGGGLSPAQASWLASRAGVRVHALGIGAAVDDAPLRDMAAQTGGAFARVTDGDGLAAFLARLDAVEARRRDATRPSTAARELYVWPLLAALALLAVNALRRRRGSVQ